MHPKVSNIYHAFTLMELAIVLIVIGLLTGGIVAGNEIYHNTKLTSIMSDAEKFRSQMKNFKDKYDYYPGDFPNATTLWGAMTSPAACDTAGTASTGRFSTTPVALTCDGRGNGTIGMYFTDSTQFSHGAPDANVDMRELREKFYVWQHLSLAGYLGSQYSGHSSVTGNNHAISPGVNVPETGYSGALGFTIEYWPDNYISQSSTRSWPVQGRIGHLLSWSHPGTTVAIPSANLITAINARKIDRKIDDGKPFSGNIFVHGRDGGSSGAYTNVDSCTTGTVYQATAENACGQYYRNFLAE